ncbi:MAG: hypothetical protein ACTS6P_02240, partial [Candidatus Hodgkinia cicadicola]
MDNSPGESFMFKTLETGWEFDLTKPSFNETKVLNWGTTFGTCGKFNRKLLSWWIRRRGSLFRNLGGWGGFRRGGWRNRDSAEASADVCFPA